MEWTLEVIVVPVSDVDRAKDFYADKVGFKVDVDTQVAPGIRIVQLTPPGSRCSIALTEGLPGAPGQPPLMPGTLTGLQLCVTDIAAAREELVGRGVRVSAVRHAGPEGWADGPGAEPWNSFMFFSDPDGNGWTVQEAPAPLSER
ncbi:VOC family protein [Streptomyces sp. NPDC102467]|uniref:VOC family protein n=1 Tax=Streptomyces sp. NPDC102467 TaxID=3366179 RepID=UPI00380B1868